MGPGNAGGLKALSLDTYRREVESVGGESEDAAGFFD
jgi:hypothetical protein